MSHLIKKIEFQILNDCQTLISWHLNMVCYVNLTNYHGADSHLFGFAVPLSFIVCLLFRDLKNFFCDPF